MGVRTRTHGPAAAGVDWPALVEALEDGQHEGGRLAGARLGAREQVAAGEDVGNGSRWTGVGSV